MPWPEVPKWREYRKHKPPPRTTWKDLVLNSGKHNAPSFYCHGIDIEEWEMRCVVESALAGREIPSHRDDIRYFWMRCERTIGASCGRETEYLFVQWEDGGALNEVHGHPITLEQLRKKGAQV